jgi:glycosyltransferase involved in cell wall biosynthesis
VQFVEEALESVLAQTLSSADYEIILISCLPPGDLDSSLLRLSQSQLDRIRIINPAPQPIGPFHAEAIRQARGRVLAILNDDDRWAPNRLEVIREAFDAHPDLGFFHNTSSFIDENGQQLRRVLGRKSHQVRRARYFPGTGLDGKLRILHRSNADFNSSSIAINTSIVQKHLSTLQRIAALDDTFYFYLALLDRAGFFLSPQPLTYYRLHGKNLSFNNQVYSPEMLVKAHAHTAVQLATLDLLRPLVVGSRRPNVMRLWRREHAFIRVVHDLQGDDTTRRSRLGPMNQLLRDGFFLDQTLDAKTLALASSGAISPGIARLLYSRFRG